MGIRLDKLREAGLTPRQSECLALWAVDRYNHTEIAKKLGISQQAVSSHIAASQKRLMAIGLPEVTRTHVTKLPASRMLDIDRVDLNRIRGCW